MENKTPPTPEMESYISNDIELKEKEKVKDELRPIVISQFREGGNNFEGISHRLTKKIDIDKEKFYNWVKENWPDKINSLKVDAIDPQKFEAAYARGEIDYEEIPPECYYEKVTDVITVSKRRS